MQWLELQQLSCNHEGNAKRNTLRLAPQAFSADRPATQVLSQLQADDWITGRKCPSGTHLGPRPQEDGAAMGAAAGTDGQAAPVLAVNTFTRAAPSSLPTTNPDDLCEGDPGTKRKSH